MHCDYEHVTGVNSDEQLIALRWDERDFVVRVLGPALDRAVAAAVTDDSTAIGDSSTASDSSAGCSAKSGSLPRQRTLGNGHPATPAPYSRFPHVAPVLARLTDELWSWMISADVRGDERLSVRLLDAFTAAYARAVAAGAGLPPFDLGLCLWRRALMLSRPPSLESEGCRRRLAVVPDGAVGIRVRDVRRYAGQQPCVQMLAAAPAGGPPLPDLCAMRKIEALVSIDVRPRTDGRRRLGALTTRTTGGDTTVDFALVRVLQPRLDAGSRCFRSFLNAGPLLGAGPALLPAERELFRLVRVTSLSQPRWVFPAFGDEALPPGKGDILPWEGPFVSVFVMPGA